MLPKCGRLNYKGDRSLKLNMMSYSYVASSKLKKDPVPIRACVLHEPLGFLIVDLQSLTKPVGHPSSFHTPPQPRNTRGGLVAGGLARPSSPDEEECVCMLRACVQASKQANGEQEA